eukprot:7109812-Prymnesium_polylepis.1
MKSECDGRGRRAVCRDAGDGRDEQARPGQGPTHPLSKRRARWPRDERLLGGGGETTERGPAILTWRRRLHTTFRPPGRPAQVV